MTDPREVSEADYEAADRARAVTEAVCLGGAGHLPVHELPEAEVGFPGALYCDRCGTDLSRLTTKEP